MRRIGIRFRPPLFSFGVALISISAGVARFVPDGTLPSAAVFAGGLVVITVAVLELRTRSVILHERWDHHRVYDALRQAPDDSVVRILQTWFPEEDFISTLRGMYLAHKKQFALQALLLDPGDTSCSELLAARVRLRGLSPAQGAEKIRSAAADLMKLKETVESKRRESRPNGRKLTPVDVDVRFFDFLPFGPIYQIGDEVMFVGLFLNHGTSAEGPMIELRNTAGNRLWHQFAHGFEEGWAAPTSRALQPSP